MFMKMAMNGSSRGKCVIYIYIRRNIVFPNFIYLHQLHNITRFISNDFNLTTKWPLLDLTGFPSINSNLTLKVIDSESPGKIEEFIRTITKVEHEKKRSTTFCVRNEMLQSDLGNNDWKMVGSWQIEFHYNLQNRLLRWSAEWLWR